MAPHPALLLHGFTGSAAAWGQAVLEPLERDRDLLAVDLPGHGASPAPPDPEDVRIERVVEGLIELLDCRGVERADWVGYSMGGRVALAAAALRPERVHRLVLESGSPGLPTEAERARRRRDDEALARKLEERGIEWFVDHWMALPLFRSQASLPREVLAAARRRRLSNEPAALAAVLRGLGTGSQPSFWDHLPAIDAATLLVTGQLDAKYVAIAERMHRALPRARHVSVKGAGHTVHLEAPRAWVEAVTGFLDRDPRGAEGEP